MFWHLNNPPKNSTWNIQPKVVLPLLEDNSSMWLKIRVINLQSAMNENCSKGICKGVRYTTLRQTTWASKLMSLSLQLFRHIKKVMRYSPYPSLSAWWDMHTSLLDNADNQNPVWMLLPRRASSSRPFHRRRCTLFHILLERLLALSLAVTWFQLNNWGEGWCSTVNRSSLIRCNITWGSVLGVDSGPFWGCSWHLPSCSTWPRFGYFFGASCCDLPLGCVLWRGSHWLHYMTTGSWMYWHSAVLII